MRAQEIGLVLLGLIVGMLIGLRGQPPRPVGPQDQQSTGGAAQHCTSDPAAASPIRVPREQHHGWLRSDPE